MITVSEGTIPPKPSGENELIFDFSDGQTWWVGDAVSCGFCHFEGVFQEGDPVSFAYSFRYRDGSGASRGRGVIKCPTCGYDIGFGRILTDR